MKQPSRWIAAIALLSLAPFGATDAAPCLKVSLTGTQGGPPVFEGQAGSGTLVRYGDRDKGCGEVFLQFDGHLGTAGHRIVAGAFERAILALVQSRIGPARPPARLPRRLPKRSPELPPDVSPNNPEPQESKPTSKSDVPRVVFSSLSRNENRRANALGVS